MADSLPALIVGAGISGLVCAYTLRGSGAKAHVLEAAHRPGGLIESLRQQGFLFELGPQSFSSTEPLRQLFRDLGIDRQLVEAPPRAPRFVLIDGALQPVPLSPPAFFASSLVGSATKWSILRDIFGRSSPPVEDESISAFARRKFSAELLEKLAGPLVSGVYAGDPDKLSLRAAFPQLYEAEMSAGSVVRGVIRSTRQGKQPGERRRTLQSFQDGNETVVRVLAGKLGSALHLGTRVTAIRVSSRPAQFRVSALVNGSELIFAAQNLILAVPTDAAAALLADLSPDLSNALGAIEYAPVAVVSLAYRKSDVGHDLAGFGFLIPHSAGLQVLGSVWNTSLFPARAPDEHVLITSFVGGAMNPSALSLSAEELAALVHREIGPILRAVRPPALSHVKLYERAIPQYNLGHLERVAAIEKTRSSLPGLFFVGNYLRGPAIGACVEQAHVVASQVIRRLKP